MKTEIFLNLLLSSVIFAFPRKFPVETYTRIRRLFKKKSKNTTTEYVKNPDVDYNNPKEVQLEHDFQKATKAVANLNSITTEQSLAFYGLYKQTLVGDCNIPKPNENDMVAFKKW